MLIYRISDKRTQKPCDAYDLRIDDLIVRYTVVVLLLYCIGINPIVGEKVTDGRFQCDPIKLIS